MAKISVIGSINMDLVVVSDNMPGKGETCMGKDFKIVPGGKGANQAVAVARMGGNVEMFGCIGNDEFGKQAAQNLQRNGIIIDHLKPVSDVTGIASINVSENDNRIVVVPGANLYVDKSYVDEVRDSILQSDIVLMQHEIPYKTVEYIVKLCWEKGVPVVLNPAPALPLSKELIQKVKYITPNEHEVHTVMQSDEDLDVLLARYPNKLIVTLGKNGVTYHDGTSRVNVPAAEANVVDTTGAGDTFCGAFVKKISEKASIYDAVVFAQYASGLAIEKLGAQSGMPTLEEINKRIGAI